MKSTITLCQRQIAAKTGRLILSVYHVYTSLFIKRNDLVLPHPPVQQREIILIRKTGQGYRAMADVVAMN